MRHRRRSKWGKVRLQTQLRRTALKTSSGNKAGVSWDQNQEKKSTLNQNLSIPGEKQFIL